MNINKIPFMTELETAENVLIAGAGGGFDIFSGLPIYFYLKSLGKNVYLANLTFSNLWGDGFKKVSAETTVVTADSQGIGRYFPEKHLCKWFRQQGEEIEIYCFSRTGAIPIRKGYKYLCDYYNLDTVILVDGGTDSLMRGDEFGLGTPQEDIASIAAVNELKLDKKYLLCIGFGVDTFHGVNHYQFLEAVADLSKTGNFLGAFSALSEMDEVKRYKEAYNYVEKRMPDSPSIVTSSIISAIDGEYGDFHATHRTAGSKLWINPIMSMYWAFNLQGVAKRCLYLDLIKETQSYEELSNKIVQFRTTQTAKKEWEEIPV